MLKFFKSMYNLKTILYAVPHINIIILKIKIKKKCTTLTNAYQALIVVLLIVYLNYFKK